MAHFTLLWKARAVEKHRSDYEKEKLKSIAITEAELPRNRLSEKWRSYRLATSETVSRTFSRWFPNGSTVYRCFLYLKSEQTLGTFLLKSVLGFVIGIILTYLCFIFFVFQLSISFMLATIMSSIIGVLLTFGLAFSYRIRCLVFLLVPQLFSRIGRYTLTCYALVLILTGPATNTLKNSEILSESMACSQEQIKTSVREINESHKIRYSTIKDNLKIMMERFEEISKQLTNVVVKINRLILSIVSSVQETFDWLKWIATNCNQKTGAPYEYCKQLLNEGVKDCKDVLGPDYFWLCDANNVAEATCGDLRKYECFCGISQLIDDSIPEAVKRKLNTFSDRIKSLLYMELHIHHSYSFSSNTSRSASQVAAGIVTEIRNRADPLLTWLSWSSCVTSLFLLLIIFRAKYYQQMYDTRSRYDNRYITQELRDLDLKRLREGRETILPLTRRERAKYVTTTSFRLVPSEKVHLNRSAIFMTITTFKLLIHIMADYSLYWVLMTIKYYGKLQSPVEDELPDIKININSSSFAARFLKSLVNTLKIPLSSLSGVSPTSCLPDPYPPDLRRYMQIGALIFLLWFFALFEPYGLRLRHVIMGKYRPERAKTRATWLYNHILRSRGSFMKFARKKLHREYKFTTEAHLTFRKWIITCIPFKILRCLLGICAEEKHCFLCGTKEYPNDADTELIRCKSKTCPGTYCCKCFSDIGQLCTICLSPKDYGDFSDISLEKGSSEDSSDSDSDNNEDTKSKVNQSNLSTSSNDYKNKDKYYFKQERKKKKEWKYDKFHGQEDEIPLLPHSTHAIDVVTMLNDFKASYNDTIIYINKVIIKLKAVLTNYSRNFVQYYANKGKPDKFQISTLCFNENISKDLIKSTVCNLKFLIESFIQYSFYQMKKLNHFLLITRVRQSSTFSKTIRLKCITIFRRKKHYTTKTREKCLHMKKYHTSKSKIRPCNNNMTCNHLKKRQDIHKEISNEDIADTSNTQKRKRSKQNRKKKKIKKQDKMTTSCCCKFNISHFICWKQVRRNLLPCTDPVDKCKITNPSSKEIKNYKRRKKRNKIDSKNANSLEISQMDVDETRKSRMLAYFSNQDWMKNKSETKLYNIKFEPRHELDDDLEGIKRKTTARNIKDTTSEVTMKPNGRLLNCLQTKYNTSTRNCNSLRPKYYPPSECQKYVDRINTISKELTQKAILRFRDTFGLESQADVSMKKVIDDNIPIIHTKMIKEESVSRSPQPSTSFSRRMNFYRSLGVNEFDDMNGNENIHVNTINTKSSSRSSKGNGLSITIKKNTNTMQNKKCGNTVVEPQPERRKSSDTCEILNKKWLHITLKNPLYLFKKFCSPNTRGSSVSEKLSKRKKTSKETVSKGVSVKPITKSSSCQCITEEAIKDTMQMATQTSKATSEEKPRTPALDSHASDMVMERVHRECSCAPERTILQRDMGTWVNHLRQNYRENIKNDETNTTSSSDASFVFSDLPSVVTTKNNEKNKHETTVFSLSTVDCTEEKRVGLRRFKSKVVTKANQSTGTEKAIVCDVSTITDDWWSPIVERKKLKGGPTIERKQKNMSLEKRDGYIGQTEKTRKRLKNRGMMTDGKMVAFRSRTQIIPAEIADILSPSRYLLESQKYYNELFLSKYYYGDRPVPVLQFQQRHRPVDKEKSVKFYRPQTKRRHKTKRLDENDSSRKQMIKK